MIKSIKIQKDYQQALSRMESIFDAKPGSTDGDKLEALSILIDEYENDHFPID